VSFGPRHNTEDEYGQQIEVDVEMGHGVVYLGWDEDEPDGRNRDVLSKLTPDQADGVADQLREAATEARKYGSDS
jgi:hypothetical protein